MPDRQYYTLLILSFVSALMCIYILKEYKNLCVELDNINLSDEVHISRNFKTNGTIREVSAYNVGIKSQTDNSPCIGASGLNLCDIMKKGVKVCAANFVPIGTYLRIENYGTCIVLDRTNSRYSQLVDVAMRADELQRAIKFGRQQLFVEIIK